MRTAFNYRIYPTKILVGVHRRLSRLFLESPAFFEIRNIHTDVQYGPFTDGTVADRAARQLGRDWRVFRQETSTGLNLTLAGG